MIQAMQAKEIAQKVMNQEELFILDVRNTEDYNDWKIEGRSVESMNKPYFEMLDGVEDVITHLPANRELVVVCAKEGSAKFVAEQLAEKMQREIFYLEGGMKSWSEHLEPVKIGDLDGGGEVYQFVRLGKGCLSYIIRSGTEGALIDPLRLTDQYEAFAEEIGVNVLHLIDTHLHADHISGGRKLAEKYGGTYYLPPKDAEDVQFSYTPLEDGRVVTFGEDQVNIRVFYSPGHTIGSTSLIVNEEYLFTGDILFLDSIGRPDLAGLAEDWVGDLRTTLYSRYKELDQNLKVLPAHFSKLHELDETGRVVAQLGDLYEENHGLNIEDEHEFRRVVTENLPPQPNAYQEIRETNMGKRTPDGEEQTEMEIGPNRCSIS
ncbi:MBL fold metallo-hydrolase [Salsuginibacillus kocurii]|uniref:MBL fold metallo-hydrolase n=1 Tax=Salsuginibacillus kocurii TaxID=427078 RepID=UPI0003634DCC|nr:MBL fold metallo-hydrolase [Salsuginibacillus kocurii]